MPACSAVLTITHFTYHMNLWLFQASLWPIYDSILNVGGDALPTDKLFLMPECCLMHGIRNGLLVGKSSRPTLNEFVKMKWKATYAEDHQNTARIELYKHWHI